MEKAYSHGKTRRLAGMALFTAIVVVLQLLGSFIRFGPFAISLVAVPIVVGAAVYGAGAGAWLGFVFGATVLLSGDAGAFLAVSILGTVFTVLCKGICCGAAAGWVYGFLSRKSSRLAGIAASLVCPVVNTGIFLLLCPVFYLDTLRTWAEGMGFGQNVGAYMILGLVGGNFLVELAINVILNPVILRLIRLGTKENEK